MRSTTIDPAVADKVRVEWQRAVEALVNDVKAWSESQGWTVSPIAEELSEAPLGTYSVTALDIHTPRGQLILAPKARNVAGALGRVDFAVWPTMVQVMLLWQADQRWIVKTEFGPTWPHAWGQRTFVELAEALLDEQ